MGSKAAVSEESEPTLYTNKNDRVVKCRQRDLSCVCMCAYVCVLCTLHDAMVNQVNNTTSGACLHETFMYI